MIQQYVSFVFRLALLITLLLSTGCAAIQESSQGLTQVERAGAPIIKPLLESRGAVSQAEIEQAVEAIRTGVPGNFAMRSEVLGRWAYFWESGQGQKTVMFANSTGHLLKEGSSGYAFRVSNELAERFKEVLQSPGNGYKIIVVGLAAVTKNPGLISLLYLPITDVNDLNQEILDSINIQMFPDACPNSLNPKCNT